MTDADEWTPGFCNEHSIAHLEKLMREAPDAGCWHFQIGVVSGLGGWEIDELRELPKARAAWTMQWSVAPDASAAQRLAAPREAVTRLLDYFQRHGAEHVEACSGLLGLTCDFEIQRNHTKVWLHLG